MAQNRGKKFEEVIRRCFEAVPNTTIVRLPDPVMGYLGYRNICDFIVYHYPYQYFIECKSVHGNRLPFTNITDNQWKGLSDVSDVVGVYAGIICWWIDRDVTKFIPIQYLLHARECGEKSYKHDSQGVWIPGRKKRIFYNYNMEEFFNEI